jgi:Protein of unknwon function (DUF3008)
MLAKREMTGVRGTLEGTGRIGKTLFRTKLNLTRSNDMPAKSGAQQKAAGAALAAKRGEQPVSELKGASRSMYESMTEKELDEMASTKRKGKPEHASKSRSKK